MAKEDYYTSTVDGAAGWARCHAEPDYDDRPSPWDLNDWPDEDEENEEEEPGFHDEDECNCSDPGCPCGGTKRGGV